MIRVWFFHSCIPRPSLVSASSSLSHHIPPYLYFQGRFFGPFHSLALPCSCLTVYLYPFSGIWEPSLRGKGVMTTLGSSGCTGASWGSGFPLPALCQGAFMEGDESPWNDKVTCFSIGQVFVGQGKFLSNYHLEICCIPDETNLTRNLKVHGPKINRNRKAAQELARRIRTRHWFVTLVFLQLREDARIWARKIFT